jgi:hypothetical protein
MWPASTIIVSSHAFSTGITDVGRKSGTQLFLTTLMETT